MVHDTAMLQILHKVGLGPQGMVKHPAIYLHYSRSTTNFESLLCSFCATISTSTYFLPKYASWGHFQEFALKNQSKYPHGSKQLPKLNSVTGGLVATGKDSKLRGKNNKLRDFQLYCQQIHFHNRMSSMC